MKRVLDFTVADIDNPETFDKVLLEPLGAMGVVFSELGRGSVRVAWNHFVHRFYELYDIQNYEQYPQSKVLDQLIKKAESLRVDVASQNRQDLEALQSIEKALLIAQTELANMKRHREAKPKAETVYPPGVILLTKFLAIYWDDWMRNFKVKHKPGGTIKSFSYEVDSQMSAELQEHLLKDMDIMNNPGGAFLQRALRYYWGIDYTTAQMKILIQKAFADGNPTKDELKIKPHIPLDVWLKQTGLTMDEVLEQEAREKIRLNQFLSDDYVEYHLNQRKKTDEEFSNFVNANDRMKQLYEKLEKIVPGSTKDILKKKSKK